MMTLLVIGLFFLFLLAGMPIYVAMSIPSLTYVLLKGLPLATLSYTLIQAVNSFPIVAVPMFILVGKLVNEFGGTQRIFSFARIFLRETKGYTAYVNVIVSLIFSGISGAALADIGGLGQLEIKAMKDEGFKASFGAALTAATATVGPIFPPSIPLIIYAMTAEVSGVRTLLAGVLPGVVMTIFLVVLIFFLVPSKINVDQKKVKEEENSRPDTFWKSLFEALPTMFAAPLIIGCMLTGVFSPTEAGAAGVFYMIFIGILHGELRLNRVVRALRETFVSVSVILIIVTTGIFFTKVLTMEKLPILVSTYLLKITHNPVGLLLIINLMILIIGMFMESISSIVLLTPMLLPVANQIGVDPVHLGLILVLNLMIGMTTPPFGIGLYMVCEVGKVTPEAVIKELLPLYVGLIASLMMVTFLPALSLWIPKLFFG
jgi:tripartite ATP-independent transporter DctM subunit